jgi:hypothetical protein
LHSPSVFTFTFTYIYTSPALSGLSGLPGRVWGSLRGRLEESSRLGRLERVVRPAWESQLPPLDYSQLPTAFSQPTAASIAGSLQLQARSLDKSGVEGDGATFTGKKFRGYQWEPNPGPCESKLPPYRPARLHTWTQTPPLLLTYRPQARPNVSGEPIWRQ